MKKLLNLIIVLSLSNSIYAQSQRGDITLAPTFGLNLTTFTSKAADFKMKTAFNGGLIAEYYINEEFSIRSGMTYDALGAEDDMGNLDNLTYFNVPLNAAWHFGRDFNWYLNFGVSFAFLSDATREANDGAEIDIKDLVKEFDFGFSLGLGYQYFISKNIALFLEVQNYTGLVDIVDFDDIPFSIRNSRTALNIGAIFKF